MLSNCRGYVFIRWQKNYQLLIKTLLGHPLLHLPSTESEIKRRSQLWCPHCPSWRHVINAANYAVCWNSVVCLFMWCMECFQRGPSKHIFRMDYLTRLINTAVNISVGRRKLFCKINYSVFSSHKIVHDQVTNVY